MQGSIWRLLVGGKKHLGLIPHELAYFNSHFMGQPMPVSWKPPPAEIDGKSKKAADFIDWVRGAPVLSKKAVDVLGPVVGASAQFLPFHDIKGKPYFAMNVVALESGLLVESQSDILYTSGEPRRLLKLKKAAFAADAKPKSPMFKVSLHGDVWDDIFVTEPFAQAIVSHALTGVALADPMSDPMDFILAGKSPNVVPGVPAW